MIFRKRVIAPIAFAWTLAAASMAAVALSAAPPSGSAPAPVSVEDVQIGERGDQTRIAFICSAECALEKRDSAFLLTPAEASFDIDLSARSARIAGVRARPVEGGALIEVTVNGLVDHARSKGCTVGGRPAACLDLFFAEGETTVAAKTPQAASKPASAGPDARKAEREEPKKPGIVKRSPARPALREAAEERLSAFARLAPPAGAVLAKVQPIEKTIDVRKPSIRTEAALAPPVRGDFSTRARLILGKELTSAFCNNAEATLQADAWALGAMVDVGLCAAARGDVAEADAMLARLLEFTPDNYEALVGRAIIAEQADEKGVARKYYQDALNALPPIEESNRIMQAMADLK